MVYRAKLENGSNQVTIYSVKEPTSTKLQINLKNKEVQQIYEFFKEITVRGILLKSSEISIDYSPIEQEDFYNEESFQKLLSLFHELLEIVNQTLNDVNSEKIQRKSVMLKFRN